MNILPDRRALVSNLRQSIDVERGTWIDMVDIEDIEESFAATWTVWGKVKPIRSPAPPFDVELAYEFGYLTPHLGTPPTWLDHCINRELSLRPHKATATTISISPTHRIDRDPRGRLAMLTKVHCVRDSGDDLFHDLPPAAYV